LPVVVKSPWTEIISRKFISSIFPFVFIFAVAFYIIESSLLFHSAEKKGKFVEKIENKAEEKSKLPAPNFTLPEVKAEKISKPGGILDEEAKKETMILPADMKTEEPKRLETAQEKTKKEEVFAQKQVKAQKDSLQPDIKEHERTKISNLFANYKDKQVNVEQIVGISYDVKRAEIIEVIRQDVLTPTREEETKIVEKETERKESITPSTGLDAKDPKVPGGAIAFIHMASDLSSADSDFLFKSNKVAATTISDKEMKEIQIQGRPIHISEVLSLENPKM
jgi:hypothetical protein